MNDKEEQSEKKNKNDILKNIYFWRTLCRVMTHLFFLAFIIILFFYYFYMSNIKGNERFKYSAGDSIEVNAANCAVYFLDGSSNDIEIQYKI